MAGIFFPCHTHCRVWVPGSDIRLSLLKPTHNGRGKALLGTGITSSSTHSVAARYRHSAAPFSWSFSLLFSCLFESSGLRWTGFSLVVAVNHGRILVQILLQSRIYWHPLTIPLFLRLAANKVLCLSRRGLLARCRMDTAHVTGVAGIRLHAQIRITPVPQPLCSEL